MIRRIVLALGILSAATQAAPVTLNLVVGQFGPKTKDPCPLGHDVDVCTVTGYCNVRAPQNNANSDFQRSWSAWNKKTAKDKTWKLVNGGTLSGSISIEFITFNDCPGLGGIQVKATFAPAGNDPTAFRFAQSVYSNYEAVAESSHSTAPPTPTWEMDGASKSSPLYGPVKQNQPFFDQPKTYCKHNRTIFFHAVCLVAVEDKPNRTLTTYEGFAYGFEFTCVHNPVPEPATLLALFIGSGIVAARQRPRLRRRDEVAGQ